MEVQIYLKIDWLRSRVAYLNLKPKLFIVANHDTMLNLGCDCRVSFLNIHEARIVKKRGRPKKLAPINFVCWEGLLDA